MSVNLKTLVAAGALAVTFGACAGEPGNDGQTNGAGIGSGPTAGQTQTGDSSGSETGVDPSTTTGDEEASTSESPTTAASTTSASGPNFDLGGGEDSSGTSGVPMGGCQAVDFLFVIDNSISMAGEQEALVGAFPAFMTAIQTQLEVGSDYHIMVIDTDEWGRCDTANPWDGTSPGHSSCNDYIEMTVFDECDRIMGAGVVHPAGGESSNTLCAPASGKRYIEADQPNLPGMFACMATVGTAGHSSERPMDAIVAAMNPVGPAALQCNDGFLRPEALLVITFVSDDAARRDTGDPIDWYNAVVAAKEGDPERVVVLGLSPAGPGCGSGGEHWGEFVDLWGERGINGQVCGTTEDFTTFFESAVSTIDQACEDFPPPA